MQSIVEACDNLQNLTSKTKEVTPDSSMFSSALNNLLSDD